MLKQIMKRMLNWNPKGGKVTPEATKWEPSWAAQMCPALEAVSSLLALTSHCMWGGMFLICSLQLLEREQGRKRVGDGWKGEEKKLMKVDGKRDGRQEERPLVADNTQSTIIQMTEKVF